jgi:hypothetical protein
MVNLEGENITLDGSQDFLTIWKWITDIREFMYTESSRDSPLNSNLRRKLAGWNESINVLCHLIDQNHRVTGARIHLDPAIEQYTVDCLNLALHYSYV